jgi:hypothetical protein
MGFGGIGSMVTAIIGSVYYLPSFILNMFLIFGFPCGEFFMGGEYMVLPKKMRALCVLSVLFHIAGIIAVMQTGGLIPLIFAPETTKGICFFFSVCLSISAIMNILSKSKKERFIIAPLAVIIALSFWITALSA